MSDFDDALEQARAAWRWRGAERPPWADVPAPGQVSVWDFPRPPRVVREPREVVLCWGDDEIARTSDAWAVHETGHPPTVYLPLADVAPGWLQAAPGWSFCEWKGPAAYWHLVDPRRPGRRLERVGWSYPQPLAGSGAEALASCVAFYAHALVCSVGGLPVSPQPGGFYGGWVTPDLAGPFKGAPGSEGW